MKPSMKTGVYHAYLLLGSDAEGLASILAATCECVAGYVILSKEMFLNFILFSENHHVALMYQQSFMLSLQLNQHHLIHN